MTSTISSNPGTSARIAMDLGSWIANRAHSAQRLPAITFEGVTITYGELLGRIDTLAAELQSGGVQRGDRIGYLGANHPKYLETLFAASRIGAIFVPLNFRLTAPELRYIINDAEIHTLIADEAYAIIVDTVLAETSVSRTLTLTAAEGLSGWELLDSLLENRAPLTSPISADASDIAVIMYTSGTTGRPKGAMLTHGNLFWNNVNALHAFDIAQTDVSLVCAPLFHIGGLNVTTLLTLQKCGHIVLMSAFDPAEALSLIVEYEVTTMFGVPAMFLFMSQLPEFADSSLSSVRFFLCGGAPVPEPLIELYSSRGVPFVQAYGLTETSPLVAALRTDESSVKIGASGQLQLLLSEVALFRADGSEVVSGERGEICVRGPQVMAGYWRNEAATTAAIDPDGWFHTGDIGEADADGYVYVVDRVKDMLISGGENVYPAEVETVLYGHPDVAEVAIIGLPHEKWGEAVTAIIVPKPGTSITLEALRTFARNELAGYKIPLRLEIVDALPRNASGKVVKYELRQRFATE